MLLIFIYLFMKNSVPFPVNATGSELSESYDNMKRNFLAE